jgi:hypothetical protein
MEMSDAIRRWFEDSDFLKKVNEKSTLGAFLLILTGLVAMVGLVGKILDEDKSIALWLSHAISTNPITKSPELKPTFIPFVFLALFITSGFLLLIIWTVQHNYAQTNDQVALNEIMGSVRQIRDQGKQTKIKAWDQITIRYLINKDLSGSQTKTSVIKSIDLPVHYWESINSVEDEADPADSLAAINFRVIDISSPANNSNIVYLPTENGKRSKKACLFFLPPIQPGENRKFESSFQWKGMFKRLKTTSEDVEFSTDTREILPDYRFEIYLEEGSGKRLDCQITGDRYASEKLAASSYSVNGWKGTGYVYTVTNIPAGSLRFVLRAELKS